ncbi:MAG: T9SS type A sorting domain-containing protein [Crocinitomicaceae bacterium]|nr:T9SS type A sorting domain-containing protein [Crocinitomicaceae bacterium]
MRRILFLGAILLSYGTMAQNTASEQDCVAKEIARPAVKPAIDNNSNRATPFWEEDFGGGMPAAWTVNDSSGICPWVYSTDGSWGNFSNGGPTAAAPGISSTTGANGFLICDADSANHFTYGQPSGANYQYLSSYISTDAIDCSTHGSVILSFQQSFRYNNGITLNVQVSNDGSTWTTYDVSGGQANNAASPDPQTISLNVSATAANQPTVYLRFGWSARVYFWMIDDIALSEADPFDISMLDTWWGMGGFEYQYYKTPIDHAAPITFYSRLTNNAAGTLDGCDSDIDVSGTSGSVFTGSGTQISIASAASDTVISSTAWTPAAVGMYDMTAVASSTSGTDANPSDNTFVDSLEITNSTFGLDNLTDGSQSTGGITNFSSNTGQPFKIGNIYQVTIDDVVECVEIGITDDAQNEAKDIFAEVYAYDPVNGEFVFRGATATYSTTNADLGQIISIEMIVPADVFADEEILVVAGHNGGDASGSDDVRFMYGQTVPEQMVYGYNGVGDLFFLSNPRAIVIRPDFDCGLGLDEEAILDATVFPNPASDQFTVRLASEINSGTITLTDLNGRVVLTKEVSSNASEISVDVSNIANGMYTLHVQSEKGVNSIQVDVMH